MIERSLRLRVGEWVEVRSWDEIRSTLDARGRLDGLPFMPEMLRFCGRRLRVHSRADRTCVETLKQRGMDDTVWLEGARCDGSGHDGCQISCLSFWKEAWLRRANGPVAVAPSGAAPAAFPYPVRDEKTGRYLCQSALLAEATRPLGLWGNAITYLKDLAYGNLAPARFLRVLWIYLNLKTRGRYRAFRALRGETPKTPPFQPLDLAAGELVQVKGPEEIRRTLDQNGRNRGMAFTWDLLEYSGRHFRVDRKIERIIDESTGEMRSPKNAVVLGGVVCSGTYRRGCNRCTHIVWREAWLQRVSEGKKE